jgi:hypothetical protein
MQTPRHVGCFHPAWLLLCCLPLAAQVIEFESGGLRYLTQTKNGVTIMFAPLPQQIRGYAVIQVAISNGSGRPWTFRPQDFSFAARQDTGRLVGLEARTVVNEFLQHGGREDVIKLVTAYEGGLYGLPKAASTNGYEQRRQTVMAEMTNTRLKAAAAASAIVLVPVKLKPGESTDGAVFFATTGKPLGAGRLSVKAAESLYEYTMEP